MRLIANTLAGVLLASAAAAQSSDEQGGGAFSFDYIPGQGDAEPALGLSFFYLNEGGIGFYGNVAASLLRDEEPFYDTLDDRSFGDPVTDRYQNQVSVNFGATYALNRSFAVYGGLGYAARMGKAEKFDPTFILADDGYYYVDDEDNTEGGLNLNGGVVVKFAPLAVQVGYHSFLDTFSVGVGFGF